MKKYSLIAIFLLLAVTNSGATTIKREVSKEIVCECLGTYTRFSFKVVNGLLTNVKVINSSSKAVCDEWHMQRLISSTTTNHPDGVTGIGVSGSSTKNISYSQCLKTEEIEIDNYWFVEKISIDVDKISNIQEKSNSQ